MAEGRKLGSESTRAKAREFYGAVIPFIEQWKGEGLSLAAIAKRLNEDGYRLRSGKPWNAMQVRRALRLA